LKDEREREEQEKNRFLQLFSLESRESRRLRVEITGLKHELETENIKFTTAEYERDQARTERNNFLSEITK